jgi:predicted dehydrogenase
MALTTNGKRDERVLEAANSYLCQVEAFTDAVQSGQPAPLPPQDAVANLQVIEAIRRAVAEGRRVKLAEVA